MYNIHKDALNSMTGVNLVPNFINTVENLFSEVNNKSNLNVMATFLTCGARARDIPLKVPKNIRFC